MNNWTALHCHSHYSLLDGLTKPESMAKRAKSLGHKSIALTDHGTISGSISFNKACVAEEIKPIIGCEFKPVTTKTNPFCPVTPPVAIEAVVSDEFPRIVSPLINVLTLVDL